LGAGHVDENVYSTTIHNKNKKKQGINNKEMEMERGKGDETH
jgi:hypothetical protein